MTHNFQFHLFLSPKKYAVLIFFLWAGFFPAAQSQVNVEITPLWLPQTNWLVNEGDYNAGQSLDFDLSYSIKNYGALLGIRLPSNIGLEGGFIISEQGQRYLNRTENAMGQIQEFTTEVKLNYYKIPMLFFYKSRKRFGAIVKIGAQFSLLQDASYYIKGQEVMFTDNRGSSIDLKEAYTSRNLDLVIGYGLIFNINSNLSFYTLFRVDYSLNDIENQSIDITPAFFDEFRLATNATTFGIEVGVNISLP